MQQEDSRWHRIDGPLDAKLKGLRDLWLIWRGTETLAPTSRFEPQSVTDLMPWIVLADVIPGTEGTRDYDIETRFIGSAFAQYFSADHGQRMKVSAIGAPFTERWFNVADAVLAQRDCCSFLGAPYLNNFPFTQFEMCVLPFTTDGARLDSLLFAFAMSLVKRDA
ncbi:MAG: hypothetical protein HYU58_11590 [Proteobacteria bacterium]|nr:hypothetical protein [Pseudomonadota bacterium]